MNQQRAEFQADQGILRDDEIARLNDLLRSSFTTGGMVRHRDELLAACSPAELANLNFQIQHYYDFYGCAEDSPLRDQGIVSTTSHRVRWTIYYWDLEAWRCGVMKPSLAPECVRSTYRVLVAQLCSDALLAPGI